MEPDHLTTLAQDVAAALQASGRRLVLAESCTGGLVAATLAGIPGVSEHLCGSAVVYRNATKTEWLGVPAAQLDDPAIGPVCSRTAESMALGVLAHTSEAALAASVTGHLGPDAPEHLDGLIYIGLAERTADASPRHVLTRQHRLYSVDDGEPPADRRARRQRSATQLTLHALLDALHADHPER